MRVHFVSDVHGNVEALARAADGADALVVLGDLVDFVDYGDPARGIIGQVLGPTVSARFGQLRRGGRPGELMAFARDAWSRFDDPAAVVAEAVRDQYKQLFAVLPDPTFAIAGNVDLPELWPEFTGNGVTLAEGTVVTIGGLRFGFVGGIPLPPGVEPRTGSPWKPYLRQAQEYTAAVHALGTVDVLCSHAPPAVPELAYDVVSRRTESPAPALLDVIHRDRPRAALFGHVHQPLAQRVRVGRTECVNVGHFRQTGTPYVLRW
ncbi:metallophosphoesterase family protein [Pseudonocardia sp. GCM10023141]|uniref:metallophosphoesterase family protein n=1 Tax=Pseudonocardia sp. GCM10023141 TaxID=3252653 RepID=UPI003608E41E